MQEKLTIRTIDEVLDVETGELIKSEDFFRKPESEIIAYRRRLQEAIAGYESPKFRCSYCNQLLKLSGKTTRRGEVSFFSHLYDSADCEIKTNGQYTKEEIEIRKYSNIRESDRHIRLKYEIANLLEEKSSKLLGIRNVEIEKRITSSVPYQYWRQPDISAELADKKIVFELQLSTTFLSTIVDRDIFYRLHKIFIIWIFNFSENQEYVNLGNLMCKDIYYSNKRNSFVFDDKARQLSKEQGQLVLLCIWFEPFLDNGIFKSGQGIQKEEYVNISDLKFDFDTYKPYYIDADSMFERYQPELSYNHQQREEHAIDKIKKLENSVKYKENQQKENENKVEELKSDISKGEKLLKRFIKNKKWGYEVDGVEILEAKYSDATEFDQNKFARIKYNRKYGFIDKSANIVYGCDFLEAFEIFNNKCVVRSDKKWYLLNLETKTKTFIDCIEIVKVDDSKNFLKIHGKQIGYYLSMDGIRIKKFLSYKVYEINDGKLIDKIGEHYFYIDYSENRIKIDKPESVYANDEFHVCIVDESGNEIFPMIYSYIGDFKNGIAKAKRNGKFGYLNDRGGISIGFDFDIIENFDGGKAKAKKNGRIGYINEKGDILIDFEFDYIGAFVDGKAKVKMNYKYGYIDEGGKFLILPKYNFINIFKDGKAMASESRGYGDSKYGYIDERGKILIPFNYDWIGEFVEGRAIVRKSGEYGYINEQGNILVPISYNLIDDLGNVNINGYSGTIDIKGNNFFFTFSSSGDHSSFVCTFGKWGIVDKNRKLVVSINVDLICGFSNGIAIVRRNSKYGGINKTGEIVIPIVFDLINPFIDGKAKVEIDGESGVVDSQGHGVVIFKDIKTFKGKYGETIIENIFGLKDVKGNVIVSAEYDIIEDFQDGIAKVYRDKKYVGGGKLAPRFKYKIGLINESGQLVVPCEFDEIGEFVDGKAKAKKAGKFFLLDNHGNCIDPDSVG